MKKAKKMATLKIITLFAQGKRVRSNSKKAGNF
jgi:hypothetical protein